MGPEKGEEAASAPQPAQPVADFLVGWVGVETSLDANIGYTGYLDITTSNHLTL